jgi:hypothetical protein
LGSGTWCPGDIGGPGGRAAIRTRTDYRWISAPKVANKPQVQSTIG